MRYSRSGNWGAVLVAAGWVAILASLAGCSGKRGAAARAVGLEGKLVQIYRSHKSTPLAVAMAAWALRKADLPASFWAKIANSSRRGYVRQRTAVLVLFADYLRKGMTLAELARMMGNNKWLRAGDVDLQQGINGVPLVSNRFRPVYGITVGRRRPSVVRTWVEAPATQSALPGSLIILPGTYHYKPYWALRDRVVLGTSGRWFTAKEVAAALRGRKSPAAMVMVTKLGLGVSNSVDHLAVRHAFRRIFRNRRSSGTLVAP